MRTKRTKEQMIERLKKTHTHRNDLIEFYNRVFLPALQKFDGKVYNIRFIKALRDANEDAYPFQVTISIFDRYAECDMPTPVSIDNIIVDDDDVIVCYDDGFEDTIELFSYDETYEILCELCKRL